MGLKIFLEDIFKVTYIVPNYLDLIMILVKKRKKTLEFEK